MKFLRYQQLYKILNSSWISAIRGGLCKLQGFIFTSCIVTVIVSVAVNCDWPFMEIILGREWKTYLLDISSLMIILVNQLPIITISYTLVEFKNKTNKVNKENPLLVALTSLVIYMILLSLSSHQINDQMLIVGGFFSIIISILTVEIYMRVNKILNK